MMNFVKSWILLIAIVLTLPGCIKVDQTLSIESDGSGTLEMVYGMSEQTLAQMEAMKQMAAGMKQEGVEIESESDSPFDFDEADIRKRFAEEGIEGVELLDVSSETRGGWKYMQVKMAFDDLDSLKKTEFFEDSGLSLTKTTEGNYVLAQKLGSKDMGMPGPQADSGASAPAAEGAAADGGPSGASDAQMMQGMAAMFAGLRIAMTVVTPSEIIESNATQVNGRRASWIFDIDEDPQVLTKLQRLKKMRLVFSGQGLDL